MSPQCYTPSNVRDLSLARHSALHQGKKPTPEQALVIFCVQPAASSENICQKYYEEVLQRWQQRYKKGDRPGVEKKLRDAEARRATIRQDTLERLAKHMLRIQQALGKREELFNSKCTQTQKASNKVQHDKPRHRSPLPFFPVTASVDHIRDELAVCHYL